MVPKGFENFIKVVGCKCFPPLADPDCPVHGYAKAPTKFGEDMASDMVVRVRKYERLRFAVMELIAQTLERVPSVALGWDKDRLKKITELCK